MVDFAPISVGGSRRSLEHSDYFENVDALSGTTDCARSALTMEKTAARSCARKSKEWHWNDFSRDWESGITTQTARNSSGMAKRQTKETAGAISGSAQGIEPAKPSFFCDMKLD